MSSSNLDLEQQIKLLENVPGVYQFYDSNDTLLYVGKAKKLKNLSIVAKRVKRSEGPIFKMFYTLH